MKVRKLGIFNRLFILLAILLLAGNAVLGIMAYSRSKSALFEQIQGNVKNIAQCAAMSLSGELLQKIDNGDEESKEYQQIVEKLALFRDNADIEYIYTLRQTGEDVFEFVVDADPEEPATIGDICDTTQALSQTFSDGVTTVDDESFQDEWGSHLSAYSPVFVGDKVIGAVGVDISANWLDEQMQALRNLVIIVCIITYAVTILILLLLMNQFKKGIKKLNNKVKELSSGSGDLTKQIDIYSGDELEVIAENMNDFIGQIRVLVKDVANSAQNILTTGEELRRTVNDNTIVMANMNAEIEDISNNMEQSASSSRILSQSLSESADDIASFAENVTEICKIVQQANENAQVTSATAKDNRKNAFASISVLQERMEKTAKDIEKIEQVKQIAEEIGSIASQTRMLSLNAQIEAARAGSMGAGFAVVATQVGNLSNDIDRAVTEINVINSEVLSAVATLTEVLQEMIRFVTEDVAKDYDAFAAIGEEYGSTTDSIRVQMIEIGHQSEQISKTIDNINKNVQDITSTVTLTAKSANELAASTKQVTKTFENIIVTSSQNSMHSDNLSGHVSKYTF